MIFVLTDDQGNEEVIDGSILPRDAMNYKQGVRLCVAFNNYNQPIRKGGYIFVRFLGYILRQLSHDGKRNPCSHKGN